MLHILHARSFCDMVCSAMVETCVQGKANATPFYCADALQAIFHTCVLHKT